MNRDLLKYLPKEELAKREVLTLEKLKQKENQTNSDKLATKIEEELKTLFEKSSSVYPRRDSNGCVVLRIEISKYGSDHSHETLVNDIGVLKRHALNGNHFKPENVSKTNSTNLTEITLNNATYELLRSEIFEFLLKFGVVSHKV